MHVFQQHSLKSLNTFAIDVVSPKLIQLDDVTDLNCLSHKDIEQAYILGEGSNTLFVDDKAPIIIKPEFKGIEITEQEDSFDLEVYAGENWHELVTYTVNNGIYGLNFFFGISVFSLYFLFKFKFFNFLIVSSFSTSCLIQICLNLEN